MLSPVTTSTYQGCRFPPDEARADCVMIFIKSGATGLSKKLLWSLDISLPKQLSLWLLFNNLPKLCDWFSVATELIGTTFFKGEIWKQDNWRYRCSSQCYMPRNNTWGRQNTEEEAFAQMDYAFDKGINFDTAELYPIPPEADTQGRTETMIGNWFEKTGKRQDVILATKVVGRSTMTWFRDNGEEPELTRPQIMEAIDKLPV